MPRTYKRADRLKPGDKLVLAGELQEIVKVGKPVDYGTLSRKKVINIWVKGRSRPHVYYVDLKVEYE